MRVKSGFRVIFMAHPVAAPTREGVEANLARAKRWLKWCHGEAQKGSVSGVVAPWISLCEVLDETPENRDLGIKGNERVIQACDEIWLVGGWISRGMLREAITGAGDGALIRDFTHLGDAPPKETR